MVLGSTRPVSEEIVLGDDGDTRLSGGEDGVGQISSVGNVVGAKVEVDNQILLVEGFAVEELVKVDEGVVWVVGVVCIGSAGLGVLLLHSVEVVRSPADGLASLSMFLEAKTGRMI